MSSFKALVLREKGKQPAIETLQTSELPPGDVLLQVQYSSLNYKDALAVTQSAPVVRSFPLVPGIDLMGTVLASDSPDFQVGDPVILTGWGVGERYWGGFSQQARVQSEWLIPLPEGLTGLQAMLVGTAGLTAMLSVIALEQHLGSSRGSVLVTGAAGGVGSFAIALLSRLGYQVTASSGRHHELQAYLQQLGATQLIGRLEPIDQALGSQAWEGAIDTVGGQTLATLLKKITYNGCVAACGLAGGGELPTTVYPFILRGVRLLGIDSVLCPQPNRVEAWQQIRTLLSDNIFDLVLAQVISLQQVPAWSQQILQGQVRGRVVIDCLA